MFNPLTSLHSLIADLRTHIDELSEKEGKTFFSSPKSSTYFPPVELSPSHLPPLKPQGPRTASKPSKKSESTLQEVPFTVPTKDERKKSELKPEIYPKTTSTPSQLNPPLGGKSLHPSPKVGSPSDMGSASTKKIQSFTLEPLLPHASSFLDKSLLIKRAQKLYPQWKLHESPPSDEEAIKIASAWKIRASTTQIMVLTFSDKPLVRAFLTNLAKALHQSIAPTQLIDACAIDRENMWEAVLNIPNLQAIYAPPLETWRVSHLLQLVKTIPASGESFIGSCRLHFIQNIDIYLQSHEQKRLLWQQICRQHQT